MIPPKLTLVLPAHNEAEIIGETVRRVDRYLTSLGLSYEIIVGDSASTDSTHRVVEDLSLPTVRIVRSPAPGKGRILALCFQSAQGDYVGFIDADLEIDVEYVGPMVEVLDSGVDAVIASKGLDPALNRQRPLSRRVNTAVYNGIVRFLFRTEFRDHQAGLKLFRRQALLAALERTRSDAWLWDTELLVTLVRSDRTVREFAIDTRPRDDSRFSASLSVPGLLRELLAIYRRQRRA